MTRVNGVYIDAALCPEVRRALIDYMRRDRVADPRLSRLIEELDPAAADSRFDPSVGEWVDTATAAKRMALSPGRVRQRCREGTLPGRHDGREWSVWTEF